MPRPRLLQFTMVILLVLLITAPAFAQRKGDWLPVTPEDLSLKDVPGAPGAHAIMLYRETMTDDVESSESNYYRIKIFTEEGKKRGDVEILYLKGRDNVRDIKARTIRPNGSIVEFDGKIFDKTVVKGRGVGFYAKAFSMPDVQVGSIIEYKYKVDRDPTRLYSPYWALQDELFTRHAKFTFRPFLRGALAIRWASFFVPQGNQAQFKNSQVSMEIENVPAFEEEQFSPPERELRMRVEFFYSPQTANVNADEFWRDRGKELNTELNDFIGKRGGIANAANQMIAGAATPEDKLKKIYESVQHIRNLYYERERTEKEAKKEKIKDNNNIEDVLKNGYGYRNEITRLFVGLARAAGFDATVVNVAERDDHFFHKELQYAYQLDAEVARVRLDGVDRFFDPGTPNCPFGLLAWQKTDVAGLLPDKNGGAFITTPIPATKDALIERKASLRLTEDATLQGKVVLTFSGLQAVARRRDAMEKDEAQRRKDMEDELKERLPSNSTVKVDSVTGLTGSDPTLKVEYSVEIPGYAMATGRRLLLPTSVFHVAGVNPFAHAQRTYPIYFRYPSQDVDDITIELPAGYKIESMPQGRKIGSNVLHYEVGRENLGDKLHVRRSLAWDVYYFPTNYYPSLRRFYEEVRAGDEEQAVVRIAQPGSEK